MAITVNPNFSEQWYTKDTIDFIALISLAEEALKSDQFTSPNSVDIRANGYPQNIAGDLATVKKEIKNLDRNQVNQSFSVNIKKGNVRFSFSYSIFQKLANISIQQIPDKSRISEFVTLARKYFPKSFLLETGASTAGKLVTGSRIDNYELMKKIGIGYTSEVWTAKVLNVPDKISLKVDDVIALKLYKSHLMTEDTSSLRIYREFTVASELKHETLVSVYDVLISPSRGYSFIVMDYIDGDMLEDVIPSGGLDIEEILSIGKDMFTALDILHTENVLHRDIKGKNIMVISGKNKPMRIKVMDYGIVTRVNDNSVTATSMFMGSPHTASLEQLTGGEMDFRSDIHSAGTVLYQCLTGKRMFTGSQGAIVVQMLNSDNKLQIKEEDDIKINKIKELINKCTENEKSNRFKSAVECLDFINNIS